MCLIPNFAAGFPDLSFGNREVKSDEHSVEILEDVSLARRNGEGLLKYKLLIMHN